MKRLIDSIKVTFREIFEIELIAMMSSLMLTPIMISHSSLRIVYPDSSMFDVFFSIVIYIVFFFICQSNINFFLKNNLRNIYEGIK